MTMVPTLKLFKVSGKFVVPGCRDLESFNGKVLAKDIPDVCNQVAPVIHEKVKGKLFDKSAPSWASYKITPAFVRGNMRFEEISAKTGLTKEQEEYASRLTPKVFDESPQVEASNQDA